MVTHKNIEIRNIPDRYTLQQLGNSFEVNSYFLQSSLILLKDMSSKSQDTAGTIRLTGDILF